MSGHQGGKTNKESARAAILKHELERGTTHSKEPRDYTASEIEAKHKERAELLKIVAKRREAKYKKRHDEVMGGVAEIKKDTQMILQTLGSQQNTQAPKEQAPAQEAPEEPVQEEAPEEEEQEPVQEEAPEEEEQEPVEASEEEKESEDQKRAFENEIRAREHDFDSAEELASDLEEQVDQLMTAQSTHADRKALRRQIRLIQAQGTSSTRGTGRRTRFQI